MKGRSVWSNTGPVPVRDLLGQREAAGSPDADAAASLERRFEVAGEEWVARPAGAGCYGTGRRGVARLLAVHFYRADASGDPVREALIPAAAFGELRAEEWLEVWSGATPIEPAR
jgi:hypothetical protein